jgi:uncharacterized protein
MELSHLWYGHGYLSINRTRKWTKLTERCLLCQKKARQFYNAAAPGKKQAVNDTEKQHANGKSRKTPGRPWSQPATTATADACAPVCPRKKPLDCSHLQHAGPPMIKFTLESNESGIFIDACESDGIRIHGKIHRQSLLLTPEQLHAWDPQRFEQLSTASLSALLDHPGDVIIIGTGQRQRYPDTQLLAPLYRQGIGFEVMSSAAACRTFNILAAEGRRPVAGIIFESA